MKDPEAIYKSLVHSRRSDAHTLTALNLRNLTLGCIRPYRNRDHEHQSSLAVEALVFDVFGTVVDWLGPVSREIKQRATKHHVQLTDQGESLTPPDEDP